MQKYNMAFVVGDECMGEGVGYEWLQLVVLYHTHNALMRFCFLLGSHC